MFPHFHGNISAQETIRRLILEGVNNIGRYLIRENNGTVIISYVFKAKTKKEEVKHFVIPSQKHHSILKNNPSLHSVQDIVQFIEKSNFSNLLIYPVSKDNFRQRVDNQAPPISKDTCNVCDFSPRSQKGIDYTD